MGGRSLIDTWISWGMASMPAPCEHRWWNPKYPTQPHTSDQDWMWIAMANEFVKYWNMTVSRCFSYCEATNFTPSVKASVKCLNDEMSAASYPRTSVGSLLDCVR